MTQETIVSLLVVALTTALPALYAHMAGVCRRRVAHIAAGGVIAGLAIASLWGLLPPRVPISIFILGVGALLFKAGGWLDARLLDNSNRKRP